MTNQTRTFIELNDLLGWRFECKHCHASLELRLDEMEKNTLGECPHCHRPWAVIRHSSDSPLDTSHSSYEPSFSKFLSSLRELRKILKDSPLGFTLSIEINNPTSDNE